MLVLDHLKHLLTLIENFIPLILASSRCLRVKFRHDNRCRGLKLELVYTQIKKHSDDSISSVSEGRVHHNFKYLHEKAVFTVVGHHFQDILSLPSQEKLLFPLMVAQGPTPDQEPAEENIKTHSLGPREVSNVIDIADEFVPFLLHWSRLLVTSRINHPDQLVKVDQLIIHSQLRSVEKLQYHQFIHR